MSLQFVNTRTGAVLPTYVVATDGGLMPCRRQVDRAGATRAPSATRSWSTSGLRRVGDKIELRNASNRNNRDFLHTNKVMQLRVTPDADGDRGGPPCRHRRPAEINAGR